MEMLLLIGCVMEGKDVSFPRLIRQCMWRAHIRGLLPFPTLVTSMAALADVPWSDDDVRPPPADADDREVTIPWGVWVHEKPPARRRSRARAVVGTPSPPAPTAGPSSCPPAAPEPTYLLVQCLFRFLEQERRHASDELDHQEEDAEAPVQQDAPDTTEPPQTQETQPVPQPQSEPEPIVVPPTDPPV
ncbi:hypothetical protein Ahy_B01g057102 isoform A [Arachis hypogaea]|uniref:Uncharacterized protein n=1 Tax=Arachis hypogaea TaxID=3818 RepID=A0A445B0C8_ARAHY|nr:hypothetical protein Ahy_B01g057102 isoform A [Arachis hypogaea]